MDMNSVGERIASLRKKSGYTQEKLAEILCVTPQVISKWENGHTLPETSLLPKLAQIFRCTIDEILVFSCSKDEKNNNGETKEKSGKVNDKEDAANGFVLTDQEIARALDQSLGNIGMCVVKRKESGRSGDNIVSKMTVSAKQRRFDLLEKKYSVDKAELNAYSFLSRHIKSIPRVFCFDPARNILLLENIEPSCVNGVYYDEDNVNGIFFRQNYQNIMTELAKWHAAFWENKEAFSQIGLDWRWTSKENLLAHIGLMQKDFETYKYNELHGDIPHEWHSMENHIDAKKMGCFEQAIHILKTEYVKLLEERFYTGKNITVIHGDLNPCAVNITWADKLIKFDGLQAVRMGLGTEDLAMLIALHIEPDMKKAKELLDYYYQALCESVDGYSYETFISDYKLAVMENMFFVIKLMNRGIYDFVMRDKAIEAFKSIVLNAKYS